ncbi:MAG TPA: hypothetical protein VI423_11010 [Paenisporosarcina sp.]|nr:hypothetical protein [Paenisporosarcina sp.]
MTTEKKTTNARPRKVAPKKEVPAKVEAKEIKAVEETPVPTKRVKRVEIDRNEMIPVRSTVHGDLIYISNRTKARFIWEEFGSTIHLEMGELQDMNGSQRKYLHDGYLVIDDAEAAEALGLTKMYENFAHINNLDKLFAKEAKELTEILNKLPKGMKSTISTKARELVEEGTLEKFSQIRAIEEALGIDLKGFAK